MMNMFLTFAVRNNRLKYLTLAIVGVIHLLLLYLVWYAEAEQPIAAPSLKSAIQVRFLSLNTTAIVNTSDANSNPLKQNALAQSSETPQKAVVETKAEQSIIHTAVSKKLAVTRSSKPDQTTNQTTDTLNSALPSSSRYEQHTQQQTAVTANLTSSMASNTSMPSKAHETISSDGAQEAKPEQDVAMLSKSTAPIAVSRVNVLSLGRFNYDDRELQNQQRLIILTIQINEKGQAVDVRIKQSSGINSLDERGINAMQRTKFKPHQVNGEAVKVIVDFPVQLKLSRNR